MDESKTVGTAFVAYSSLEKNKDLVNWFREVIEAVGIRVNLFDYGSHHSVADKDRELIQSSNCFIALIFRENEIRDGVYSAAPWIHNEIGIAYALKKPILAFVESGVQMDRSIADKITTYKGFEQANLYQNVKDSIIPLIELRNKLQTALSFTQMFEPLFYRSVQSELGITENGGVIWSYESEINVLKDELQQIFHEYFNPFPDYSLRDSEISLYLTDYQGKIELKREVNRDALNTWLITFNPPIKPESRCKYGFRFTSSGPVIPLREPSLLIHSKISSENPVLNRAQEGFKISFPTTELTDRFIFPKGYQLSDPDCHVFWTGTIHKNEHELRRIKEEKCFKAECFAERWKLELNVKNPQTGLYYMMSWLPVKLPSA